MLWSKKKNYPSRLSSRVARLSETELVRWTETTFSDLGRQLRDASNADSLSDAVGTSEALHLLVAERKRRLL